MKIIFSLLLLFAVLFTNALPTNLEKQDPQDVYRIAESYITDSESPSLDLSNGNFFVINTCHISSNSLRYYFTTKWCCMACWRESPSGKWGSSRER
jgi:hypothetical protein